MAGRIQVQITLARDRVGQPQQVFAFTGAVEVHVGANEVVSMDFRGKVPGVVAGATPEERLADAEAKVKTWLQGQLDGIKADVQNFQTARPAQPQS